MLKINEIVTIFDVPEIVRGTRPRFTKFSPPAKSRRKYTLSPYYFPRHKTESFEEARLIAGWTSRTRLRLQNRNEIQ